MKNSSPNVVELQCDTSFNPKSVFSEETVWVITVQLFIPFLLAGFGMVAASLMLDLVQVMFLSEKNEKIK